jgi:hypothetical protein
MMTARAVIQIVQRISDFWGTGGVGTYSVRAERNSLVKSPIKS